MHIFLVFLSWNKVANNTDRQEDNALEECGGEKPKIEEECGKNYICNYN